jgi:hypothetical protein
MERTKLAECRGLANSWCAQGRSCLSLAQRSCPASPSRRLAACIVGPLGLGSPRFRPRNLAAPLPAVLCVATTTFVRPGWFAFGSRPVPWVDALCFVFHLARARLGSLTARIQRRAPGCWLSRSPVLRHWLPRKREVLPSSRITPLNSCPDLRSRWCPIPLALARAGLLPSSGCNCRLWVRLPGLIL